MYVRRGEDFESALAEMSEDEVAAYLNRVELKAITKTTITDDDTLLEQLQDVKRNGFAVDDSEGENDVFCLGVSLRMNNQTYGAFSVSVPSYRITPAVKDEIVHAILKTKQNIQRELQQNYVFI